MLSLKDKLLLFSNTDSLFSGNGPSDHLKAQLNEVNALFERVKLVDDEITSIYSGHDIMDIDVNYFDNEVENRTLYHIDTTYKLSQCRNRIKGSMHSTTGGNENPAPIFGVQHETVPPALSCPNFFGEKDRHNFKSFIHQFENLIGCKNSLTDSPNSNI